MHELFRPPDRGEETAAVGEGGGEDGGGLCRVEAEPLYGEGDQYVCGGARPSGQSDRDAGHHSDGAGGENVTPPSRSCAAGPLMGRVSCWAEARQAILASKAAKRAYRNEIPTLRRAGRLVRGSEWR